MTPIPCPRTGRSIHACECSRCKANREYTTYGFMGRPGPGRRTINDKAWRDPLRADDVLREED